MRRFAKKDISQQPIVDALRAAGCYVFPIGLPLDLLVRRGKQWFVLECKTGKRKRNDQPDQQALIELLEVPVVRTPEEALTAVGLFAGAKQISTTADALAALGLPMGRA